MADIYRFAAFISYSSKDAAFAKRLHRALERYRIPSQLGKFDLTGGGKPNRIYPVFRDREELPVGDLKTLLEAALRSSNSLIVICSEEAVKSPWVDQEIEYFHSLGRGARIFPIIAPASGDASSIDIRAFFPKTLLSLAETGGLPLAADARKGKDGFRNAWMKLVAGQIGVNAGALRDRDERRRRSQGLVLSAAGATLGAAIVGGILAYVAPHTTYAKQYVRVFGAWTPVDAVSASDAKHRTVSFRFTQQGLLGPVIRVDRVNGQGNCSNDTDSPLTSITGDDFRFVCNTARSCSVEIEYASGRAIKERTRDQFGNVLEELDYSRDAVQAIRQQAVVGCSRLDNGIKFVNITRAETGADRGRDIALNFNSEPGKPRANKSSAYGYRIKYDSAGHVVSQTAVGRDSNPTVTSAGWTTRTYKWTDAGDLKTVTLTDVTGAPVSGETGWASQTFTRDDFGNSRAVANFAVGGELSHDAKGIAEVRYQVDDRGAFLSESYFDIAGRPTLSSDGIAEVRFTIDDNGYNSQQDFFGTDGKPAPRKDGCLIVRTLNDRFGDNLEKSCHHADGTPAQFKEGYHRNAITVDQSGNYVEARYFGADGSAAIGPAGVHALVIDWGKDRVGRPNEFQKEISRRAIGVDGKPSRFASGEDQGAHLTLMDYDSRGYKVRERYLDEDGLPVRGINGAFGYAEERDDRGELIRNTPLGPDGQATDVPEVSYRIRRDEFGRQIELIYVGADGAPSTYKGVARFTSKLDALGRTIRWEYYGLDGARTRDSDGGAIADDTYDTRGMLVRRTYRDVDGALTFGDAGAAIIVWKHDARGHSTEISYLGTNEMPVVGEGGWSTQRFIRDGYGNALETRFFGTAGEPTMSREGVHGWSVVYDDRGNETETVYRDLDWKPKSRADEDGIAAILRYTYDDQNRELTRRFFDENNQPIANNDGVYGEASSYNARGDKIAVSYLDANGKPGANKAGESRFEQIFDVRGFVVEQKYFGLDGALVSNSRARVEVDRDRLGNQIETRFFSSDGGLRVNSVSGRAVVRATFDASGRQLTEASFDADKEPVDRFDLGWHRKVFEYGYGTTVMNEVCFKVSGETVPCES